MIKKLLERIFRRRELKKLRADTKSLNEQNQALRSILDGEKIPLNIFEKKMILDCLLFPGYKAKVQNPATKRFIREVYRNLKIKIVEAAK